MRDCTKWATATDLTADHVIDAATNVDYPNLTRSIDNDQICPWWWWSSMSNTTTTTSCSRKTW